MHVLKCFCRLVVSSLVKDRCIFKSIAFVNASVQENGFLVRFSAVNLIIGWCLFVCSMNPFISPILMFLSVSTAAIFLRQTIHHCRCLDISALYAVAHAFQKLISFPVQFRLNFRIPGHLICVSKCCYRSPTVIIINIITVNKNHEYTSFFHPL